MEQWLSLVAHYVSLVLEAIAILMIVIGAAEAVVSIIKVQFSSAATSLDKRGVWLEFARWLVAGLTFQLAADIVETTVAPSWDDIDGIRAMQRGARGASPGKGNEGYDERRG
jgi:uncharacterized membrane protein